MTDVQAKYVTHFLSHEQERDPTLNKFIMAHIQSGNSCGITTMDDFPTERSQWHVLMFFNNMVVLLVPPFRPMENSIPFGLSATKKSGERMWDVKNTICAKGPDKTKYGSGRYHDMPVGAEGVMNAGFCEAVLISTRTPCIRSTSTHTSTSDSIAIGIIIKY